MMSPRAGGGTLSLAGTLENFSRVILTAGPGVRETTAPNATMQKDPFQWCDVTLLLTFRFLHRERLLSRWGLTKAVCFLCFLKHQLKPYRCQMWTFQENIRCAQLAKAWPWRNDDGNGRVLTVPALAPPQTSYVNLEGPLQVTRNSVWLREENAKDKGWGADSTKKKGQPLRKRSPVRGPLRSHCVMSPVCGLLRSH